MQTRFDEMQKNYFELLHKHEDLEKKQEETQLFQDSLKEAQLTTSLQKPRLATQQSKAPKEQQDKYQYIQSLSGSGMSADEIANVLSI